METSPQWVHLVVADKWLVLANWMGTAGNSDVKVYVEKALVFSFKEVKEGTTCSALNYTRRHGDLYFASGKEYKQFPCT